MLYHRQEEMNLNTNQTIVIAGAGGIGFHLTKMLIMSGVNDIHLYDFDTIEVHNLNRLDVPISYVGKKKVDVLEQICKDLRPECNFNGYPFECKEYMVPDKFDWFIDCTDKIDAQKTHFQIANKKNVKYMKVGYDGYSISINNRVASWGDGEDGYRVVPSFVAPAIIIAGLAVVKCLNPDYNDKEMSGYVGNLFRG